jgi:octaprenyl-diphosphate synthase
MRELGVFAVVAESVQAEIDAARGALQEWPDHAPTPLLLGLCDVLRTQVAVLRPRA